MEVQNPEKIEEKPKSRVRSLWIMVIVPTCISAALMLYGYLLNHEILGLSMFFLVPFTVGLIIAYMAESGRILLVSLLSCLLVSLAFLLFTRMEGILCVVLAFPILFISTSLGALSGILLKHVITPKQGNMSIILFCFGIISLAGWSDNKPAQPAPLVVSTRMEFHAPMESVWRAVVSSGKVEGNSRLLRLAGLPVPLRCTYSGGTERICHFEQGEMIQNVTHNEYGKQFDIEIVNCTFEVRKWLTFENAGYEFIQKKDSIEVIRTDTITSTLRPRWYWRHLEAVCVQWEHDYVMSSMKNQAEKQDE